MTFFPGFLLCFRCSLWDASELQVMPRVFPAPLGALGACGAWVSSTRPFLPPVTFSTDSAGFSPAFGTQGVSFLLSVWSSSHILRSRWTCACSCQAGGSRSLRVSCCGGRVGLWACLGRAAPQSLGTSGMASGLFPHV